MSRCCRQREEALKLQLRVCTAAGHQRTPQTLTSLLTGRASAEWGWAGELLLQREHGGEGEHLLGLVKVSSSAHCFYFPQL